MNDQLPLTQAVLESDVSIHTLPVKNKCLIYYEERLEGDARIIHGHGNLAEYARVLNEKSSHRIFTSLFDNEITYVDRDSLTSIEQVYYSIKLDGLRATIERVGRRLRQ